MTIGKNIKRLRQNKGMTQEQLAEKLGQIYVYEQCFEFQRKKKRRGIYA